MASQDKLDSGIAGFEIEHTSRPQDIDNEAEHKIRIKTDLYLVPMLCLLLVVAFLDRTNIGNARIQGLGNDLNMTGSHFNIALFMFFIPYIVLDIPLNILMKRLRPSMYLGSLVFFWGEHSSIMFASPWLKREQGSLPSARELPRAMLASSSVEYFLAHWKPASFQVAST
jgi:hypothetical protein